MTPDPHTDWGVTADDLASLSRNTPYADMTLPATILSLGLFLLVINAAVLGLVAAIPAVIAYNKLSTELGRYANRLEAFAGEFSAILSRQIDERA